MTAEFGTKLSSPLKVVETTIIETVLYPRVDSAFPRPSAAVQACRVNKSFSGNAANFIQGSKVASHNCK